MASVLPSTLHDRQRACRRRLTLDLFTRHGDLWVAVESLRTRWGITPVAELPPRLPSAVSQVPTVYAPATWPSTRLDPHGVELNRWLPLVFRGPASRGVPADLIESWRSRGEGGQSDPRPDVILEIEWRADLDVLYHAAVPNEARGPGRHDAMLWQPFFSACLLRDPPPAELLEFADRPPVVFFGPLDNSMPPDRQEIPVGGPWMAGVPIVYIRDPYRAEEAVTEYYEQILAALDDRLSAVGVDIDAEVASILREDPSINERYQQEHEMNRGRPYIQVTQDTRLDDVRNAGKILAAMHGQRPKDTRPRATRDPLTAAQCAIWRDSFGWSWRELGERFGWKLQLDHYSDTETKCETARIHVAEGRDLLRQRNANPNLC